MRLLALAVLLPGAVIAADPALPSAKSIGKLETVATFNGPMPTGVTVSQKGRIFVNFPRWGDPVDVTVAELKNGKPVAFPSETFASFDKSKPGETLVSVQSVVVDPADRLWILDTGSIEFGPVIPGGAKLVGVDLEKNEVVKSIAFPPEVVLKTTYLNDVRFDLRKGKAGVAYITDSSLEGPNGIIVVDLDSGRSWRRLHDHASTKAVKNFRPVVEGQMLMERKPGRAAKTIGIGSDGIAIDADGAYLYFCPLASRHLYRVPTKVLLDEKADDVAAVEDLGDRGFASDGLESDDRGRIYLTDYEHNAIMRRTAEGEYETLVHDPRALWPDTLSLASDGFLYFTANQLHRQKNYHSGTDLREKPYVLFRVKVDANPVRLAR